MTIRVVIADDQQLVRTGFRLILESEADIKVVGEASNGLQAISCARQSHPDVVLMDIRMPELDGIEATRRLTSDSQYRPARVLILTTFDLDEYVFDALRSGASGFLLKDGPADKLTEAVRVVAAGDALLAPAVTRRLIEAFAATATEPHVPRPAAIDELTPRELDVLRLVATGMSNAEIATALTIGETTVKTHVTRLLMKLGLRDRVQAVVLAYDTGIASPGSKRDT